MPSFIHGKGTKVYIDENDLSAYFNSADVSISQDTAETTGFGASSKTYLVGLADATISLSGMWAEDGSGLVDGELQAILGESTTPIITVAYDAGTIGKRAVLARAHETSYSISSPVSDVVSITADFNASTDRVTNTTYGVATGVQLTTGGAIAYGSLGALASVDGAAATTLGGIANLHVVTNSVDDGVVLKVQHSADDSTWADLITFTTVASSSVTSEQKAVSGTVNRYLRVTASSAAPTSGSITYLISFARY